MTYMRKDHRGPSSRISGLGVVVIIALGVAIGVIGLNYKRWELRPPDVTFDREFSSLGKNPVLNMTVDDAGSGLSHVTVRIKQKGGDIVLVDEGLNNESSKSYDLGRLLAGNATIAEGPATLTVTAADHGLLRFFQGNRTEITRDFKLDTTPPTLEVFAGQHYINQGGSDCVVYRVSEDVEVSGVQAGPHFFPGFAASKSDPKMRFALFALAYDLPADTQIQVIARDGAGNETKAGFWQKVLPHKFRSRDIPIDDNFLHKVIPEILSHSKTIKDTGEPVKVFVDINSNLRKENHAEIAKLAKASPGEFLWNGSSRIGEATSTRDRRSMSRIMSVSISLW
jgi:hypothetical protein